MLYLCENYSAVKTKSLITALCILASLCLAPSVSAQLNLSRLLGGVKKAVSSLTLTDEQVAEYVHQYIQHSDSVNKVLPSSNPYSQRLAKITKGITQVDGMPLNFAVYQTDEVNAFACADGSVRVYTGLLDLMDDQEVLGVIGHEIGHVAHHDSKSAFKQALMNEAIKDGLASTDSRVAALTDSQLSQIGTSLIEAKFSRKQEQNADDYGYDFLKANGRNPIAMAYAFQKLQQVSEQGGAQSSAISQLFSSHPDVSSRISRMVKKAKKDGFPISKTQ